MTTTTHLRIPLTDADVAAIERLAIEKGDDTMGDDWITRTYDTATVDDDGLLISGHQLQALEWYVRAAVLHPDDFAIPVVRGKLSVALDDHGLGPI